MAFIGLHRGNLRCSYVQSGLVFDNIAPCTFGIIDALFNIDCIPGRTISKWPQGEIFVGTLQQPTDVESNDYQHHSTHFREIGRLHDVLDGDPHRKELHQALQPAVNSDCRSNLVAMHGLDEKERIYVLYIWEEVRCTTMFED